MSGPQHHVLLIGIDAYDGGGSLDGCVNDIDAIQRVLIDRVGVPPERITRLAAPRWGTTHETTVPERIPTLDAIRDALAQLAGDQVAPGDRVLIYYSGHGTRCVLVDGQGRRFAREALLPKDKEFGTEVRFVFDWEIDQAIARIRARTPRVTVVLDCCCAGGVTRSPPDPAARDRFWATANEVAVPPDAPADLAAERGLAALLGRIDACQVIAACRDDERARESAGEGLPHGELTRALVAALAAFPDAALAELYWGQIWRATEAAVRVANPRQSPWMSGAFGRRVFGFGDDGEGDRGFAVAASAGDYMLDVGRLHGITEGAEIAVYDALPPAFPPLDSADDVAARRGRLRVTVAAAASCTAGAIAPFTLPAAPRGRLVAAGADDKLQVRLVPDDEALAAVIQPRLLELTASTGADVTLVRGSAGDWALTDELDQVLAVIPADQPGLATDLLEHYAAYIAPVRLARRCRDLPNLVRLSLLDCGAVGAVPAAAAQDLDLPLVQSGASAPYELAAGGRYCVAVDNAAEVVLSTTVLACTAAGAVRLLGEARIPAGGRHLFWAEAGLGVPHVAELPDGAAAVIDRIVAIGTTSTTASLAYLARERTFAQVLTASRTRALATVPEPPVDSWSATVTSLRIRR